MGVLANLKKFLKDGTGLNHIGASNIGGAYTTDMLMDMQDAAIHAAKKNQDIEKAMRDSYRRAKSGRQGWFYSPTDGGYAYGWNGKPPTGYGVTDWKEVQGPIPFNDAVNLNEDEAMDLLSGDNGAVVRAAYDEISRDGRRKLDDALADPKAFNDWYGDDAPLMLDDTKRAVSKMEDAGTRLFPDDNHIMLDPQMYTGDEYAPWVKNAAKKYINGEY